MPYAKSLPKGLDALKLLICCCIPWDCPVKERNWQTTGAQGMPLGQWGWSTPPVRKGCGARTGWTWSRDISQAHNCTSVSMGREWRGQEWALLSGMGWEIWDIASSVRTELRLKKKKFTLRIIKHWGRFWTFWPWRFSRHDWSKPHAFYSELNVFCAGSLSRDLLKPFQPQELNYLISCGPISLVSFFFTLCHHHFMLGAVHLGEGALSWPLFHTGNAMPPAGSAGDCDSCTVWQLPAMDTACLWT